MKNNGDPCVICRGAHTLVGFGTSSKTFSVTCMRCGRYQMDMDAVFRWGQALPVDRQRANAAGWLRANSGAIVLGDDVARLLTLRSPTKSDRAFWLLEALDRIEDRCGAEIRLTDQLLEQWAGVTWSIDGNEVVWLLDSYLAANNYLNEIGHYVYRITASGYEALLRRSGAGGDSKVGFCAMWFDESVRTVWSEAIRPAVESAGYEAVRIDNVEHNNKIDDEIVAAIRRSRFVVADFTGHRGGVYFEAGFAQGLGIPVIWTIRHDELPAIHFDTRQYNFIVWERDQLVVLRDRVRQRIEATVGRGPLAVNH